MWQWCGEWITRGIDWKQRVKNIKNLKGIKKTPFDSLISPLPWHPIQLLLETVLLGWIYFSSLEDGKWKEAAVSVSNTSPRLL